MASRVDKTKAKEYEELLKGKVNPELAALGQALAEKLMESKLRPGHKLTIEIEFEERIEAKMLLEQSELQVELWLDYTGEWRVVGAPQIVIYD